MCLWLLELIFPVGFYFLSVFFLPRPCGLVIKLHWISTHSVSLLLATDINAPSLCIELKLPFDTRFVMESGYTTASIAWNVFFIQLLLHSARLLLMKTFESKWKWWEAICDDTDDTSETMDICWSCKIDNDQRCTHKSHINNNFIVIHRWLPLSFVRKTRLWLDNVDNRTMVNEYSFERIKVISKSLF